MKRCVVFSVTPCPRSFFGVRGKEALMYLLACVSLLAIAALPANGRADVNWSLSVNIGNRPSKLALSPIDRGNSYDIWAEVISGSYGVSVEFVKALYDRRYDFGEIALMLEIAHSAGKEPSEIATLRRKKLGWGAIAKEMGIHPAALNRAKGDEALFRRYVLASCLAGYYGMPDSKGVLLLAEKGYEFDEIALAANVCAHAQVSFEDVVKARAKGAKWKAVAEKFNVSPLKLGKPPAEQMKGKGKSTDKDKQKSSGTEKENTGKKKKNSKQACPTPCPRRCY